MDIRLKIKLPSPMDGDFATTYHTNPLVVEEEKEVEEIDSYGIPTNSVEVVEVTKCSWKVGKNRQFKVKMCEANWEEVMAMVSTGTVEFVDATEAKMFEEQCKPKAKK